MKLKTILASAIIFVSGSAAAAIPTHEYDIYANQVGKVQYCLQIGEISTELAREHIRASINMLGRRGDTVDTDRLYAGATKRKEMFLKTYGKTDRGNLCFNIN